VVVPLLMLFFIGTARTVRMQSSAHYSPMQEVPPPPLAIAATIHQDEQEMAHQIAEICAGIERMNIHELMDRFDAPRIAISAPSPATIPWWAWAPLAAIEATSHEAIAVAKSTSPCTAEHEAQLDAEATAAVKLIAAQTEATHVIGEPDSALDAVAVAAHREKERWEAAATDEKTAAASIETDAASQVEAEDSDTLLTAVNAEAAEINQAAKRPDWVKYRPKRVGKVLREVIVTDEWYTEPECERQRGILLMLKTYEHLQQLVGVGHEHRPIKLHMFSGEDEPVDSRLQELQSAGITLDYALREIATAEYLETNERSVGPMKKLYTLIEFAPGVDDELRRRWDAHQRRERVGMVGMGAGSVFALLGLTFGLLKVDTWTKGYYTKRLFLGVPAAIIGVVTLLLMAV
jgi:hypothetical protein